MSSLRISVLKVRPYLVVGMLAICSVMFGLYGCFSVREPAPPSTSAQSGWVPPTDPLILISNFKLAFTTLNITNYPRCFADKTKYKYVPDPTSNTSIWLTWNKDSEVIFMQNLLNKSNQTNQNSISFTQLGILNNLTSDSVEYNATYNAQFVLKDTTFGLRGITKLLVVRNTNTNEWAISQWFDNRSNQSPSLPCITDLKQRYAQ